jgi:hypothetical protein
MNIIEITTVEIYTSMESYSDGIWNILCVIMRSENTFNTTTVTDNVTPKLVRISVRMKNMYLVDENKTTVSLPCNCLKKKFMSTSWYTIDCV